MKDISPYRVFIQLEALRKIVGILVIMGLRGCDKFVIFIIFFWDMSIISNCRFTTPLDNINLKKIMEEGDRFIYEVIRITKGYIIKSLTLL